MNQRSMAVLKKLAVHDGYISIAQLSDMFNVSRRSIYNDIGRINDWLQEQGLTSIQQVRSEGIYLDDSTKKAIAKGYTLLEDDYYEYTKEERKAWIYLHITCGVRAYFVEDLQELFQVSRNTILDDVRILKNEIESHQLNMYTERGRGYHIIGNETDVRKVLIQYLSIITPIDSWYSILHDERKGKTDLPQTYSIFNRNWLHQIHRNLIAYEKQFNIEIIDDVLNSLVIWFHFFMKRMQQGSTIDVDPIEKEVIESTDTFLGAKMLCQELFKVLPGEHNNEEEVYYFAKYLLSAKVNYDLNPYEENSVMQSLVGVVEKMVADFQLYAAVEFDEPKKIIENLLLHLKPAYYRIKYGIKLENTLRDSVKKTYPEVFHITKLVMKHFEELIEQPIDENEVAFIATHFGGWLRKEGVVLDNRQKRLLIVCTNGLGTSKLLESQLLGLFSNIQISGVTSLREYQQMDLAVDFIVSTIPLPDRGIPVFVVSPVLSNDDKEQLLKKVNSMFATNKKQDYSVEALIDMVKRYATIHNEDALQQEIKRYLYTPGHVVSSGRKRNLKELLPSHRIRLIDHVDTWQKAIKLAAQPLIDDKTIEPRYVDKMLRAIYQNGPYIVISERFALPHAGPNDGVKKTGMSMLCLQQPVDLLGKNVSIFVVLASKDNEQHLKALAQLTKLFSNKNNKQLVMDAHDKHDIYKLIKAYSYNELE
ncbi:BglG family transcription antiterminator [Virgibacillus proomii]|uniref:BglG family transcription antiterminator n=1 Tax=Virgibacillus proomii TaxID=84407 RepID=UPI0015C34179|nr:BglG family transcription antiterminator [Virgibacillus proomii]